MPQSAMVEYRRFRNTDPPHVRQLWNECGLGRGAALGIDANVFESVVFGLPYFDPHGLILAETSGRVVGYAHAGFGSTADEAALDHSEGVICAVMVHPDYRRQGIGRSLVHQAERYLRERGAAQIFAGPAAPRDPFYFGIYGGSQPAGFLESDALAAPFFAAVGYAPAERHLVMQRSLTERGDPVGGRLMTIRRETQLTAPDVPSTKSWWWHSRAGRLDSVELALLLKSKLTPLARVTTIDLDFYLPCWRSRGIGLLDLYVEEPFRRKGYGQALLAELCRRVRDEMIQLVEAHAAETDHVSIKLLESVGFRQVDVGVVYRREKPA